MSPQNRDIGLNNSALPCFRGFHRHLSALRNKATLGAHYHLAKSPREPWTAARFFFLLFCLQFGCTTKSFLTWFFFYSSTECPWFCRSLCPPVGLHYFSLSSERLICQRIFLHWRFCLSRSHSLLCLPFSSSNIFQLHRLINCGVVGIVDLLLKTLSWPATPVCGSYLHTLECLTANLHWAA